jgi:glycogen synthase
MRILHVINRYWPTQSGSEIHFEELSARLAAEGHRVVVATTTALDYEAFSDPRKRRLDSTREFHRNVEIRRFPLRYLPGAPGSQAALQRLLLLFSRLPFVPVGMLSRLSRFSPFVPGLLEWAHRTEERFDLVAGMNILFPSILQAGFALATRQGIPFVIYPITHLGAGVKPGAGHPGPYYTMRHQLALVKASACLVAQTNTEKQFYQIHGMLPDRIKVVGPGIDPIECGGGDSARFIARHGLRGPVVSFLSSMVFDKGVMHLVEAVRQLWDRRCQIELVLAGTSYSAFREWWRKLPAEVRSRAHLLGSISDEEKRDLLAASDIIAVPSRTDSFGMVYLEAWFYGKPVIGSRAWGMNDVIEEGRDGMLVEFGNVRTLAGAIWRLAEDPELRNAMGAAGRLKVLTQHTWDHKHSSIRSLYHDLTEKYQDR